MSSPSLSLMSTLATLHFSASRTTHAKLLPLHIVHTSLLWEFQVNRICIQHLGPRIFSQKNSSTSMKCPGNVKNDQRQTCCPVVSMHRHIIIWMLAANYTFVIPSLFSSSRTLKWTYPWLTSLDSNTSAVPYFLLASATFHAQKFFLYIISSCKHLSWAHFSLIG